MAEGTAKGTKMNSLHDRRKATLAKVGSLGSHDATLMWMINMARPIYYGVMETP